MTDQEKKDTGIETTDKGEQKKAYESPAIADEGTFETVVLSCPRASFEICGGVSS